MVRPNTKLRPRIFIASRTAVRTTGSPSRPTARPSAAFQLSERSCAPSSTLPVSSSEKVAALTNDESDRAELLRPVRARQACRRSARRRCARRECAAAPRRGTSSRCPRPSRGRRRGGRRRRPDGLCARTPLTSARAVAVASPSLRQDQPRLRDALGGDLLFVGPVGAPQLGPVDRPASRPRAATRAARGNACTSCPIRTGTARCG